MKQLETEYDNLRAALQWAIANNVEAGGRAQLGLQLVGAMGWMWYRLGYLSEGHRWLEEVLAQPWAMGRTAARAKALQYLNRYVMNQKDRDRVRASLEESVSIWRELVASSANTAPSVITAYRRDLGNALCQLTFEVYGGNIELGRTLGQESVALLREVGDKSGLAASLRTLANISMEQGDYAEARQLVEEGLALSRDAGNIIVMGQSMTGLGRVAEQQGDDEAARTWYEQALVLRREAGDRSGVTMLLNNLGYIALQAARSAVRGTAGDYQRANALLEESLAMAQKWGFQYFIADARLVLGKVALAQGEQRRAAALVLESLSLFRELGFRRDLVRCLVVVAEVLRLQVPHGAPVGNRQLDQAVRLCGAADVHLKMISSPFFASWRADYYRTVAALRAQVAESVFAAAWAAGQAMSLEQAIETALEGVKP